VKTFRQHYLEKMADSDSEFNCERVILSGRKRLKWKDIGISGEVLESEWKCKETRLLKNRFEITQMVG